MSELWPKDTMENSVSIYQNCMHVSRVRLGKVLDETPITTMGKDTSNRSVWEKSNSTGSVSYLGLQQIIVVCQLWHPIPEYWFASCPTPVCAAFHNTIWGWNLPEIDYFVTNFGRGWTTKSLWETQPKQSPCCEITTPRVCTYTALGCVHTTGWWWIGHSCFNLSDLRLNILGKCMKVIVGYLNCLTHYSSHTM